MSFLKNASRRGWIYTFAILFNRIVPQWLFRCRRFAIYRLAIQPPLDETEIELKWCQSEQDFVTAELISFYHRKLATGPVQAVLATFENEPTGAFWVATEQFDETELGIRLNLAPKQCWLFAAMVDKHKRGHGIYSKILQFTTSELGPQGYVDLLVAVNPFNKPSSYVHKKNSVETVGYVTSIRCFRFACCCSSRTISQSSWITTSAKSRPIELSIPRQS